MRNIGLAPVSMVLLVTACGGGGSATPQYAYSPPALGTQRALYVQDRTAPQSGAAIYTTQTVVFAGSDGSVGIRETIGINPADPSVVSWDPNLFSASYSLDASGRLTAVTFDNGPASGGSCTFAPHGPGPQFPITVGMSWRTTFQKACNAPAPVGGEIPTVNASYIEDGRVLGFESVTNASSNSVESIKTESQIVPVGGLPGESITVTQWLDPQTGQPLKMSEQYSYGTVGTVQIGTLLDRTRLYF